MQSLRSAVLTCTHDGGEHCVNFELLKKHLIRFFLKVELSFQDFFLDKYCFHRSEFFVHLVFSHLKDKDVCIAFKLCPYMFWWRSRSLQTPFLYSNQVWCVFNFLSFTHLEGT